MTELSEEQRAMKNLVGRLRNRAMNLAQEKARVDEAIRATQAICDHDFEEAGHDSHKDHYVCSICGKEESE